MTGRSPFWKTWAAVAILAGLGAYIYFVESKRPAGSEKAKEKAFTLDKAKVKEITLNPTGGDAIHLVKQSGNWWMSAPLNVPADSSGVDGVLSTLESLEIDEVVAPSAPRLADYGLAPPKVSLSVVVDGVAAPVRLALGDKAPAAQSVYAQVPGQPRVFTVASYVVSSLDKKPFDLRDRDVLHVRRDAVRTLEVAGSGASFALSRGAGGEFAFTKPVLTLAGRWAVDSLLGTLEGLRMDSAAAEEAKDLKPFGLEKPAWVVTLGLSDGGTRRLEVGSSPSAKKYYAREASKGLVSLIPGALVDDLAKGMGELRAKRLLDVATYEVDGLDLSVEGKPRVYARTSTKGKDGIDTNKWKRTSPDAKDVETTKVEDVLVKVGGVEVKEFLDKPAPLGAYGLDAPSLRLTIRSGAQKPAVWVEFGQKDGATFARRSGDDAVLKLDGSKAEDVLKAFKEL